MHMATNSNKATQPQAKDTLAGVASTSTKNIGYDRIPANAPQTTIGGYVGGKKK
jgi:hypothetical protein